jgi:hypothetical protein
MNTLSLANDYKRKFGAVFTPFSWAKKIVAKHFFKEWLNGATILDPTVGDGIFIECFIALAKENGVELNNEKLSRLFGIELNPKYIERFFERIRARYSIHFPKTNFIQGDILFQKNEIRTDFLVGNPPWVNFTDLDENYKEKIKPLFLEFGLVKNTKDLLLGNARTDIATLILMKVIHSNLKENGKAIFFLPLSIFLNDIANQEFRNYNVKGIDFCVENIMDFNGNKIFEEILGRYGVAEIHRNRKQKFPIKYHILENGQWRTHKAKPLFNYTDPLTIFESEEQENRLHSFQKIILPKHSQPRQGINTCGANEIFFFSHFKIINSNKVELKNKLGDTIIVSTKYVFPLTVSSTLTAKNPKPEKVVLIPHFENGKPIDINTLKEEESLFNYLSKYKTQLQNRKGVLINTLINKGFWWALLGVGAYSFLPYKIMWKAFGDNIFAPRLLHPDKDFGSWQGNQSLNAFIGASTLAEAKEILTKLENPLIQEYLSSMRMQGTCNWAQPGRMKKLMEFV